MEDICFSEGSVPVCIAAKVYGKDASWIRAGIIVGWLPIGMASWDKYSDDGASRFDIFLRWLEKRKGMFNRTSNLRYLRIKL